MSTKIYSPAPDSIEKVISLLNAKEVVALPTETVYGLAGSAISNEAVEKIFKAKDRPAFDPLIVHVKAAILTHPQCPIHALVKDQILSEEILKWPQVNLIETAMKKFWPGPLTMILPRGPMIPDSVTSGQNTVGIRCPAHPIFQAVLNCLTFPLAAPSANQFGRVSPTTAQHVFQELNGRIPAILDGGPCSVGVESTIIKVEDPPFSVTLLRPGKIGLQDLQTHFGVIIESQSALGEQKQKELSPGMLDEHYAPQTPLIVIPFPFSHREAALEFLTGFTLDEKTAFIGMSEIPPEIRGKSGAIYRILSPSGALSEMAQNLFATLRELDRNLQVSTIFIDLPPDSHNGLSLAIRDRLKRASKNKPSVK